jgi:hypothetical protein
VPDDRGPRAPVVEEELDDDIMGVATGWQRDPRGGLERQSRARPWRRREAGRRHEGDHAMAWGGMTWVGQWPIVRNQGGGAAYEGGGVTGGGVRPGDHDVAARLEEARGLAITMRGRGGSASARATGAGAVAHVLMEDARAEEAQEQKERTVISSDTM